MLFTLARKNLLNDKLKLLTAVVGVVFASVLMNIQVGMLLGFVDTITSPVAKSPGDLWIVPEGTKNFDMVTGQSERRHYQALATDGVAWSSRLIVDFTLWRTPDGRPEQVSLIAIDPERPVGMPWAMAEGSADAIWHGRGVIVDHTERDRLGGEGGLKIGDEVEIKGHRATVVGFSKGVRSFTTTPYVFTSLENAKDYAHGLRTTDQVKYVVVGVAEGQEIEVVRQRLQERLQDVEVLTKREFMTRSVVYWLLKTGAGIMSILAAVLGLLVGGAIVGQQIYSQTMEKFREYGTFKALGGTNAELAGIILAQALMTAAIGYVIGVVFAVGIAELMRDGRLLVQMPPLVVIGLGLITGLMCVLASLTSVARVVRLEPAIVFKA